MVDRVRSFAKLQNDDSRYQRKMELYSRARGLEKEEDSHITDDAVNEALSSLDTDTQRSLSILKRAFVQDVAHIVKFLRHKSALHFVIGRLISGDPYEQLEALECCCNASCGDAKSCSILAVAGGIYFIQIVHGTNIYLITIALTTLGNLCASNFKTSKHLHEQGLGQALLASLKVDETRELAVKSLCQFNYMYLGKISDEEVLSYVQAALPYFNNSASVKWLVAQLSARESVRVHLLATDVVSAAIHQLQIVDRISDDNVKSITALIRLIGNMSAHIPNSLIVSSTLKQAVSSCNYAFVRNECNWMVTCCSAVPVD